MSDNLNDLVKFQKQAGLDAFSAKNFPDAVEKLRTCLAADPGDAATAEIYADACWQLGLWREFYFAKLAAATGNGAFLDRSNTSRLAAFEHLQATVRSAHKAIRQGRMGRDVRQAATKLQTTIPYPYPVKANAPVDAKAKALVRSIAECEATPNTRQLDKITSELLPDFLRQNSNHKLSTGILFRIAQIFRRNGKPQSALCFIEKGISIDKRDAMLCSHFEKLFAETYQPLRFSRQSRTIALVLSCMKNKERAAALALDISRSTATDVVLLTAEQHSADYKVQKKPYGYQLTVPCDDGYLSLAEKLQHAWRYLSFRSNCTGVLKVDDDIAIKNPHNFTQLLTKCRLSPTGYVGERTNFSNSVFHHRQHQTGSSDEPPLALHNPVNYANGGKGYYLSRANIDIIAKASLTFFNARERRPVYEDIFFAEVLSHFGVALTPLNMIAEDAYVHDIYTASGLLNIDSSALDFSATAFGDLCEGF